MEKFSEIFKMKVSDLKEHPANSRFFNEPTQDEIRELKKSLKSVGLINPIIINKNNEILSGHQRWKVLKDHLKEEYVYVRRFEGSPSEEIQLLIDDNVVKRNINPECYVKIKTEKYKYYTKEEILNLPNIAPKIKNILLENKEKISKDFLAKIATLLPEEQVIIIEELQMLLALSKEKFEIDKNYQISEDDIKIISKIKEQHPEIAEKFLKLQQELNNNHKIINNLYKKLNESEQEIEKLKSLKNDDENKIKQLQTKIKELEEKTKNAEEVPENIKREIEKYKSQIAEIKENLQKKNDDLQKLETEKILLEQEYDLLNVKYNELLDQRDKIVNEKIKEAVENYRETIRELQKQIKQERENYNQEIERLREQLKELEKKKLEKERFFEFNNISKFLSLLEVIEEQMTIASATLLSYTDDTKDLSVAKEFFKKLSQTIFKLSATLLSLDKFTHLSKENFDEFKNEMKRILKI